MNRIRTPRTVHPDDHRQVVGLRGRGGPLGSGRQHLDRGVPDGAAVAGHEHRALAAAARGPAGRRRRARRRARACRWRRPRPPGRRARRPGRRRGRRRGATSARAGSASMPSRSRQRSTGADVRPGVHQHPGARPGREHEGVALADVAGDRRPSSAAASPGPPAAGASRSRRARPARPARAGAAGGTARAPTAPPAAATVSSDGAARAGRPAGRAVRQRGGALGDHHQPARRPAGDPDERVRRAAGRPTPTTAAASPSTVAAGDRRRGEQVGRQRDQADRAGEPGDERRRHQARGGADGQRHRRASGQQPRARSRRDQSGREQHDRGRGGDGEGEPGVPRQPRVEEQQHADRRAQCGQTAARGRPVARASSVTAPMAAARTTLGLGRASTTKPIEHQPATTACTRRSTARRRSGHRTAVSTIATFAPDTAVRWASPARRKSSSEHRVHRARVAHDEPRQQSGRPRFQDPPGGGGQSLPAAHRRPAAVGRGRPAATAGPRADTTATTSSPGRAAETTARTRTRWPGQQVAPLVGGREEQHRRVQPVRDRPRRSAR